MKKITRFLNCKASYMLAGVLIGAIVFGGGFAMASNRDTTMNISYRDVKIVVDGTEITPKDAVGTVVEPFISDGTTYLPVRAVSEALGKEVTWDGSTSTVYIGEVPAAPTMSVKDRLTIRDNGNGSYGVISTGDAIPGKLANGESITDENILAILAELEAIFPDGTSWGDGMNGTLYTYANFNNPLPTGGGCNSFAGIACDLIWGKDAEYTTHNDLSKVKCGDIVRLYNESTGREHWLIVSSNVVDKNIDLGINDGIDRRAFTSCEGNVGGRVSWNAERPVNGTVNDHPNSTVYSFN